MDNLTKRAKFGENAFLNIYQKLYEAPDPTAALSSGSVSNCHPVRPFLFMRHPVKLCECAMLSICVLNLQRPLSIKGSTFAVSINACQSFEVSKLSVHFKL